VRPAHVNDLEMGQQVQARGPCPQVQGVLHVSPKHLFLVTDKLGSHLLRVLVHELRHQTTPYKDLSEAEQEGRTIYLQDAINQATEDAVKNLVAAGFPCVVATLKKITVEDGVNAVLTFDKNELHALSDAVGSNVVLCLVDPQTHAASAEDVSALVDKDQSELPLGDNAAEEELSPAEGFGEVPE
jgi:hypothetical protein